jgi:hypothetical protein
MHPISRLLSSVMCLVAVVAIARAGEAPKAGVIQVQVTGELKTDSYRENTYKEIWTVTGYVRAEGRDLLLDCSDNVAAGKLIDAEGEDYRRREPYTTPILVRYVQVKGRLEFRSKWPWENQGKQADKTETPVIVVESLKIVEKH